MDYRQIELPPVRIAHEVEALRAADPVSVWFPLSCTVGDCYYEGQDVRPVLIGSDDVWWGECRCPAHMDIESIWTIEAIEAREAAWALIDEDEAWKRALGVDEDEEEGD